MTEPSLAERLREIDPPTRVLMWPLLADLAEAAAQVIPAADGLAVPPALRENFVAFLASLDSLDAAFARVAAQLDHEEGTT